MVARRLKVRFRIIGQVIVMSMVLSVVLQPFAVAQTPTPSGQGQLDFPVEENNQDQTLEDLVNRGVTAYIPGDGCGTAEYGEYSQDATTNPATVIGGGLGTANPSPIGGVAAATTNFNPDPKATLFFEKNMMPKLKTLIPLYQRAAQEENVPDWEILAGMHNIETGLSRRNVTNSYGYMSIFQMGANEIRSTGASPSDPRFAHGRQLSDADFVFVAKTALKVLKGKGNASTVRADLTKPLNIDQVAKVSIAWNAGQNSKWLTGGANPNMMPFAWAGYDSGARKLPMSYEQGTIAKPGVATTFMFLKNGNISALQPGSCTDASDTASGTYAGVKGTRAEIAARILKNPNLQLGAFGNGTSQRNDILNPAPRGLTDTAVILLAAMVEQSGVPVPINSLKSDHANDGGDHPKGRAIDVGYCGAKKGSGKCADLGREPNGQKLYAFVYQNRAALKVRQMIWQYPGGGLKCVGGGVPVDCNAYYASSINQHYHHIHIGVSQ